MQPIINVNGDFTKHMVHVLDQGFLYGFGLFETMRAYHGQVFSLDRHLDRLYSSAALLAWELPWTAKQLEMEIERSVANFSCPDLYVRLSVSRGDMAGQTPPSFVIIVRPYEPLAPVCYEQGWSMLQVAIRRNSTSLLSRVKSMNYLDNLLAKQEAKQSGADEGLLLNEQGYVAEGTLSNIFMVVKSKLITPAVETGILNGVTRQLVLELAQAQGLVCEERLIALAEIATAEELFCTNSLMEIMPVTCWENHKVGGGVPGPVTQMLRNEYAKLIKG